MGLVAETAVQRVTVPHEDAWIEIQPLSWSDLETARRIKTEDSIKQASLFDASMLKEIQASATGGTAARSVLNEDESKNGQAPQGGHS